MGGVYTMVQIIIKQAVAGVLMSILKDPKKTVKICKIHSLEYFFKLYKKSAVCLAQLPVKIKMDKTTGTGTVDENT
jgi:hypothetical protein